MRISDKAFRTGRYRASSRDETFLAELNKALTEEPPRGRRPRAPVLFVTGAPRSGTTLLAQALCHYLTAGYVDGLAARFWRAPSTGLRLSKTVFGDARESEFRSSYGRSAPWDIHGFHYFWMQHLNLSEVGDLFEPSARRDVDWEVLLGHLTAMEEVTGRPMLYKGYYPSYFMSEFCRRIPAAVFVVIRRDPLEQAMSLYEARIAYHGDPACWYSMQPPEVERLLHLPPEDQIAGQILGLNEMFDRQIAEDPCVRAVDLSYEDLVNRPAETLRTATARIDSLLGKELDVTGNLPRIRPSARRAPDPGIVERLTRAIRDRREARPA